MRLTHQGRVVPEFRVARTLTNPGAHVKAILHTRYGPPDLLQFMELDKPVPKNTEILIRVRHDGLDRGLQHPQFHLRYQIHAAAGETHVWYREALEASDPRHRVSRRGGNSRQECYEVQGRDRVFGSTGIAGGGHAQYACLPEKGALAIKPDCLSWEEAVAIPFGANTASYFLRDLGHIQAGQKLLIIGASGSIGSAAVQLAKHFGAAVTAVCSGGNAELVKSLGAHKVIDYRERISQGAQKPSI